MNESSDGCRSFGNGSGSALRTVDVMGAGSPCARADRTPASSISADIARYSSGGKRTICSRVHTDTPPGTNPRIPRGCCIEVSTTRQPRRGMRCTAGGMHAGSDAGGGDRPAAERRRGCLAADPPMGGSRAMPPRVCAAECTNGREESAVDSSAADLDRCQIIQGAALRWGARREDDDGLATEGQDTCSERRRCRC